MICVRVLYIPSSRTVDCLRFTFFGPEHTCSQCQGRFHGVRRAVGSAVLGTAQKLRPSRENWRATNRGPFPSMTMLSLHIPIHV